jgi:hypothetical protein
MLSCQEISHITPTVMHVAAKASTRAAHNAGALSDNGGADDINSAGFVSEMPCMM